ncbi:MAG: hypothetical protein JSW10_11955 [Pseudomonadota bacterium]|nr:MAG: hypothetical protein JSW10_11955 [Pseudomonadota bacterium]
MNGRLRLALTAITLVGAMLATAAMAADSDRWEIAVKKNATSDGSVVFRFHPRGAYPFDITVHITAGTKENDIAARIHDVLQAELPKDAYELRVSGGEKVKIEAGKGVGDFNLVIVQSGVSGVEFKVKED